MTENSQIFPLAPTRQSLAVAGRSGRLKVTGKLKAALLAMVWDNKTRKEAAEQAGLADASLRFAFRKPHVMSFYHAELAALRTNLRAKNVHRLDQIADASKNDVAKVNAIRTLETLSDADAEQPHRHMPTVPGLTIVIMPGAGISAKPIAFEPRQIDGNTLADTSTG